ncbi:MAG: alpha-ketoacid dehydrogenase subunit beta [Chloroflexi bacterium]|nr:alpha-ketoacid dehydrogenase subunit beta [Chloroflexota bacterium]
MAEKTVIQAIKEAIAEEMAREERMVLLGEDIGKRGGVFRVTEGLIDKCGEERVIDTPLAELGIVGIAIGLALNGMRPMAEIQFADFIHPAFDQIVSEMARMRYRSNGTWTCPMVIRAPYGGGIGGGLYHSQSVEAFFAHVPGLKVVVPGTPYDAKGLLKSAMRDEDPVMYFEHKKTYRLVKGEVPEEEYTVPIGEAEVKREGTDLTVITYGLMLHYSLQAAEEVAKDGISVEIVDLRTVLPLDKKTILESVGKTSKVLIVHEDNKTGGLGGEVAAIIAEEAFDSLDAPIMRLCGPDVPAVPFSPTMQEAFMPNPEKIAEAIRKLAAY